MRAADARSEPEAAPATLRAALAEEHERCQHDEHEPEHGGRRSVKEREVLQVDRSGQRVVLHERDRAEVRQHVERAQQARGAERGPEHRERDVHERCAVRAAEAARGLLEARVGRAQRGRAEQEDVGVGREGQREQRAGESEDLGDPLDPKRSRERLLQQAARTERAEQRERGDVARHDDRQCGQQRDHPVAWHVGSGDEPGERNSDHDRAGHDGADKGACRGEYVGRARAREHRPGLSAALQGSHEQVDDRENRDGGDDPGRRAERSPAEPHARVGGRGLRDRRAAGRGL